MTFVNKGLISLASWLFNVPVCRYGAALQDIMMNRQGIKFWVCLLQPLLFSTLALGKVPHAYVKQHAIPLERIADVEAVATVIEKYQVVVVGEIHGTVETPMFVKGLVTFLSQLKSKVILGLEIPQEEQKQLREFIRTGNEKILKASSFFSRTHQDGRSSIAIADLLRSLSRLKNVSLLCFDVNNVSSAQDRDTEMAENIARAHVEEKSEITVILSGNIHGSLSRGTPWNPDFRPMGYELHEGKNAYFKRPEILAIRSRYYKGAAWVCFGSTVHDCKVHYLNTLPSVYSQAVAFPYYFLKEPDFQRSYQATFFTRRMTPSSPYIKLSK